MIREVQRLKYWISPMSSKQQWVYLCILFTLYWISPCLVDNSLYTTIISVISCNCYILITSEPLYPNYYCSGDAVNNNLKYRSKNSRNGLYENRIDVNWKIAIQSNLCTVTQNAISVRSVTWNAAEMAFLIHEGENGWFDFGSSI